MMRLRKKYSDKRIGNPPPADADKLLSAQSVRRAIIAAVASVLAINLLWVWLAVQTGKFFPWLGILQGVIVGIAVQRAGRGVDWRFPVIAATAAAIGHFSGGFFVALSTTELELQTNAISYPAGPDRHDVADLF